LPWAIIVPRWQSSFARSPFAQKIGIGLIVAFNGVVVVGWERNLWDNGENLETLAGKSQVIVV
jgi:hypothetical protein